VPPGESAGPPSDGGAWYRLDPTPGRETVIAINEQSVSNRAAQAFDYVELLWRDYVLSLNRNRQEDIVYDPLNAKVGMVPSWVEWRRVRRWLNQWSATFGLDFGQGPQRRGRSAFEPMLAVLIVSVLMAVIAAAAGLRLAVRAATRWWSLRKPKLSSSAPAFYRRLERVLARLPAVRESGETPGELAHAASQQLSASDQAAAIPPQIVASYYRVRFGGGHLDKMEIEAIEHSLDTLATAIAQDGKTRVRRRPPTPANLPAADRQT
jgi:hypothetical protein